MVREGYRMTEFTAFWNGFSIICPCLLYLGWWMFRQNDLNTLKKNLFSKKLTVSQFCANLDALAFRGELIERLDLDRVDVDNFSTALIRLFQRRQHRSKYWNLLRKWWFNFRGRHFGSNALQASEQLHLVIIGRRFSSRLSHMVLNPSTKKFELEIWEKKVQKETMNHNEYKQKEGEHEKQPIEGHSHIVQVPISEISGWVKQAQWEEEWWDREEEELLIQLHAAQLRACLSSAGVEPWEFVLYHGGFAQLAGLSCHVHSMDFEFLEHADCTSYSLRDGKELSTEFPRQWRSLQVSERREKFKKIALSPSPSARHLEPLVHYEERCRKQPNQPLVLYLSSPMTAVATTFNKCRDLALRVTYVAAMGAAWDGSKNLLGTCFNNATDYPATMTCCGKHFFPNARFVLIPTETCKMGPFTLNVKQIENLMPSNKNGFKLKQVFKNGIQQWTELKRGEPQALFDAVTMIRPIDLFNHIAVVPVEVVFGKNLFSIGTRFEDLGMTLRNLKADIKTQTFNHIMNNSSLSTLNSHQNNDHHHKDKLKKLDHVKGRLNENSLFLPGELYSTEMVFSEKCEEVFIDMIKDIFNC